MKIIRDATNRIYGIDMLRGIAILIMVFDHILFDYLFIMPFVFKDFTPNITLYNYWYSSFRQIGGIIIPFIFLLLTGISCSFSKSNFIRGMKLALIALGITGITLIISFMLNTPDIIISCGILHCISVCLIIIGKIEVKTLNKYVYLLIGLFLFILGCVFKYKIYDGNLPILTYKDGSFAKILILEILGLAEYGSDCFSLTFYGGIVFIGVFIGRILYPTKKPLLIKKYIKGPVSFLGRNTLLVYLLHQIIIPIIMSIIFIILGYSFSL